jgi:hypothetical protein
MCRYMAINNCVFTVSLDLIMLPYLIKLSPGNITANMFTMAPSGPVCTFVHKTTKNSDVRASPSPVHKSTTARETAQTTVRIRKGGDCPSPALCSQAVAIQLPLRLGRETEGLGAAPWRALDTPHKCFISLETQIYEETLII